MDTRDGYNKFLTNGNKGDNLNVLLSGGGTKPLSELGSVHEHSNYLQSLMTQTVNIDSLNASILQADSATWSGDIWTGGNHAKGLLHIKTNAGNNYYSQLGVDTTTNNLLIRSKQGGTTWTDWASFYNTFNANNYTSDWKANDYSGSSYLVNYGGANARIDGLGIHLSGVQSNGVWSTVLSVDGTPQNGIVAAHTGTYGVHGSMTANKVATYFTQGLSQAGWAFRSNRVNVASIGSSGDLSARTITAWSDDANVAPFVVYSQKQVTNLNASLLGGKSATDFLLLGTGVGKSTYGAREDHYHLGASFYGKTTECRSKFTFGDTNLNTWVSFFKYKRAIDSDDYEAITLRGTIYNMGGNWRNHNCYDFPFEVIIQKVPGDTNYIVLNDKYSKQNAIHLRIISDLTGFYVQFKNITAHTDIDIRYIADSINYDYFEYYTDSFDGRLNTGNVVLDSSAGQWIHSSFQNYLPVIDGKVGINTGTNSLYKTFNVVGESSLAGNVLIGGTLNMTNHDLWDVEKVNFHPHTVDGVNKWNTISSDINGLAINCPLFLGGDLIMDGTNPAIYNSSNDNLQFIHYKPDWTVGSRIDLTNVGAIIYGALTSNDPVNITNVANVGNTIKIKSGTLPSLWELQQMNDIKTSTVHTLKSESNISSNGTITTPVGNYMGYKVRCVQSGSATIAHTYTYTQSYTIILSKPARLVTNGLRARAYLEGGVTIAGNKFSATKTEAILKTNTGQVIATGIEGAESVEVVGNTGEIFGYKEVSFDYMAPAGTHTFVINTTVTVPANSVFANFLQIALYFDYLFVSNSDNLNIVTDNGFILSANPECYVECRPNEVRVNFRNCSLNIDSSGVYTMKNWQRRDLT